jgi:predicted anti-sigma-YlaC factor YlaD
MKMHTCLQVTEVASAYLDDELPFGEWALLTLHLRLCPPCRAYVDQLGLSVEALRGLGDDEQPEVRDELLEIYRSWRATQAGASDDYQS